jgi:very-short-patch-repair endonuclease
METETIHQLHEVAAGQHGLVTLEQAASVGASYQMIRAATERGWLRRERRGIYVVAGAAPSRWRPVVAAGLAAGPDAAVSHTTAAAASHIYGVVASEIEVTVPRPISRSLQGVRIHRGDLPPRDVEIRNGVRVTTPVRTLIDLTGRFRDPLLGKVIDEGAIARLWTAEAILERLDGPRRGVAGATRLRDLLVLRVGEGNPDSQLEQRVVRVLKQVAPGYTLHHQVVLEGEVIDMDIAWADQKVDGEIDGLRTRAKSRTKFERSCRRQNMLTAHGWRIVHFTAGMDDATLVAQVAPLLGL